MNLHELGILAVHLIKFATGKDVALLVRTDTRRPATWCTAGAEGARRAETACVRLMQAQAQKGFAAADYYLYTTERPTAMCLGMAKRCHVIGIVYRRGSKVKYNTWQDVGAEPRDLTSEMKEMIPGLWAREDPWRSLEARLERGPSIARTLHDGDAESFQRWIWALSQIREVAVLWLSLSLQEQLKPVPAPRFVGAFSARHPFGRPASPLRDKIYMALTFALLAQARRGVNAANTALAGQQIAAVLVGPDGRLLSWGINTNDKNVTRHGETNCLQSYFEQARADVPDYSTLYTTLQSCEMCSGMLVSVARHLRVVYGSPDSGIGTTALQRRLNSCWEERFVGSHSNPVARANFQRWGEKANRFSYQEQVDALKQEARDYFRREVPKPKLGKDATPEDRKLAGLAHTAREASFVQTVEARYRRSRPFISTGRSVDVLPSAITGALSSAPSMANISAYRRHYMDLGMMMLTRVQCRPDRDHMGFTVSEIRAMVQRDERAMPILRHMTQDDFDVWREGDALLDEVARAALL